jgi:hypothetical protein
MAPAPGKDLCAKHAAAFDEWRAGREAARGDQQRAVDGVLL